MKVPSEEIRLNCELNELEIEKVPKKLLLSRLAYRTSLRYLHLVQLWMLKEAMVKLGLPYSGIFVKKKMLMTSVSIKCIGSSSHDKLKAILNAMKRIDTFMNVVRKQVASIVVGSQRCKCGVWQLP